MLNGFWAFWDYSNSSRVRYLDPLGVPDLLSFTLVLVVAGCCLQGQLRLVFASACYGALAANRFARGSFWVVVKEHKISYYLLCIHIMELN